MKRDKFIVFVLQLGMVIAFALSIISGVPGIGFLLGSSRDADSWRSSFDLDMGLALVTASVLFAITSVCCFQGIKHFEDRIAQAEAERKRPRQAKIIQLERIKRS